MDSYQDDIFNPSIRQQIPNFDALITDGVAVNNLEEFDLFLPRGSRIASLRCQLVMPLFMFMDIVIFTPV